MRGLRETETDKWADVWESTMGDDKKTCFIIMPITTPDSMLRAYKDDTEHFTHVYECLFEPSVTKAGYEPIPPKAKGADVIHADIVTKLEDASLVLCDMSCLNPNVFFELGIRTSLNKPVCLVADDQTAKVPFDTGIINFQPYDSSLKAWNLQSEVDRLSEHLKASGEGSEGGNTLWKVFGMQSESKPYEGGSGSDTKMDYLTLQVESLRKTIDRLMHVSTRGNSLGLGDIAARLSGLDPAEQYLRTALIQQDIRVLRITRPHPREFVVVPWEEIDDEIERRIEYVMFRRFECHVRFELPPDSASPEPSPSASPSCE